MEAILPIRNAGAGNYLSKSEEGLNEDRSDGPSERYLNYVVALLALTMLLNQMDRNILAVLAEPIRKDFSLSDSQLGLLTGLAFAFFYTACGVPLARLADRTHRGRLMAACLVLWSAMTAMTGFAGNFYQLLLFRTGVAIGEAGNQPIAHSLLADFIPKERQARAFSWLAVGISTGAMAAYLLGGWLGSAVGWRWTLTITGLSGLPVAALVLFTLREPVARHRATAAPVPFRSVARVLLRNRSYLLLSATAIVASGRRTGRPAMRRPSKACGLVTSCTRWRSI